ncbi:MAG: hypothetical protein ABW068_10830 [Candidatus Thiodiazotropha sp.]
MTIYHEAFRHDGYADFRIEMRILRRGQKEVILHYGKQYRHVVDFETDEIEDYRIVSLTDRQGGMDVGQ